MIVLLLSILSIKADAPQSNNMPLNNYPQFPANSTNGQNNYFANKNPEQGFHAANSSPESRSNFINNEKSDGTVFSNSIDLSKVKNNDFLKDLNLSKTSKGMEEWLNSSPEARNLMNKVFLNYGVLTPEKSGYSNGIALPSPQYLLQTVEESLAIHASFKENLRRLLENVQQYLTQCSLMLAETVIRLERKHEQILLTMEKLNKYNGSGILKTNYSKQLFDLRSDAEDLIKRFQGLKQWKIEVEGNIKKSL
jgi:hypothetical protein